MSAEPIPIVRIATQEMTASEARQCVQRVRNSFEDARKALLELYQRQGWRALGYASWRACAMAEFEIAESRVYQLLRAAEVEQQIIDPTVVERLPGKQIPEQVLRPLTRIPSPEKRKEIWEQATAEKPKGELPTGTRIAELVKLAKCGGSVITTEVIASVADSEEEEITSLGEEAEEKRREGDREEKINRAIDHARLAWKHARVLGADAEAAVAKLLDAKQLLERLL